MRLGRSTRYCHPSRNWSEVIWMICCGEVPGYKTREIFPFQAAGKPSSRNKICLMRSQETVSKPRSKVTKCRLVTRSNGGLAIATDAWMMNCPEWLRAEPASGCASWLYAAQDSAHDNASIAVLMYRSADALIRANVRLQFADEGNASV